MGLLDGEVDLPEALRSAGLFVPANAETKATLRVLGIVRSAPEPAGIVLGPAARQALDHACGGLDELDLGRASRLVLAAEFAEIVPWAERHLDPARGTLTNFVLALARRHVAEHRAEHGARLALERQDEVERDDARSSQEHRDKYVVDWRKRIEKMVRQHPRFWSVPGYAPVEDGIDEVARELVVRLLDAISDPQNPLEAFAQAGASATLRFLVRQRTRLRKHTKLHVVPDRLDPCAIGPHTATPEEQLAHEEQLRLRDRLLSELFAPSEHDPLSKTQRRWVDAFAKAARESRDDGWGLAAAVARARDKDRSSATRALAEIRERLGGDDTAEVLADLRAEDHAFRPATASDSIARMVAEFSTMRVGCTAAETREILKGCADLAGVSLQSFAYFADVSLDHLDAEATRSTECDRTARSDRGPWSLDD